MWGCGRLAVVRISARKPLGADHGGELWPEEVHSRHAAGTELALEAVTIREGRGQAVRHLQQAPAFVWDAGRIPPQMSGG